MLSILTIQRQTKDTAKYLINTTQEFSEESFKKDENLCFSVSQYFMCSNKAGDNSMN